MAEKIGSMPCDTKGCGSEMSVMQDKREKFYTVCKCGRNTRNTNFGQELFKMAWSDFQKTGAPIDDINGLLVGGISEDEPEKQPEIIQENSEPEKEKSGFGFFIFAAAVIGGGVAAWQKIKQ